MTWFREPQNNRLMRAICGLMAVAIGACLLTIVIPSTASAATNRSWLRADNSRNKRCEWDRQRYFLQQCEVWSRSMKRNIRVQVQPAARGGNAGLYLLDGLRARDDWNAWTGDAKAQRTFFKSNITLVMPVGGRASFYTDWNEPSSLNNQKYTYRWETFLTRELPAYLHRNFGVSPRNNSIAGISMGGSAALTLAAFHRKQFRQALTFSGYLQPSMVGMKTAIRLAMLDEGLYNVDNMWGLPWDPRWGRNDPFVQAERLRGLSLYLSSASGIPGAHNSLADILAPIATVSGIALEGLALLSHVAMDLNLTIKGIAHTNSYRVLGTHSWGYWRDELAAARPFILNKMRAW